MGVGRDSPLQAIFPTQGSNPGLLHCRQILYHLKHQGSPWRFHTPLELPFRLTQSCLEDQEHPSAQQTAELCLAFPPSPLLTPLPPTLSVPGLICSCSSAPPAGTLWAGAAQDQQPVLGLTLHLDIRTRRHMSFKIQRACTWLTPGFPPGPTALSMCSESAPNPARPRNK